MYSDFIAQHPIFKPGMSASLKSSFIPVFLGLGLPVPMYSRQAPWGYTRNNNVYLPIEKDLLILLTALEMAESKQYLLPDILNWVVEASPSRTFERRNWFLIKKERPPFPELRLPFEERVNLVYRLTPPTT